MSLQSFLSPLCFMLFAVCCLLFASLKASWTNNRCVARSVACSFLRSLAYFFEWFSTQTFGEVEGKCGKWVWWRIVVVVVGSSNSIPLSTNFADTVVVVALQRRQQQTVNSLYCTVALSLTSIYLLLPLLLLLRHSSKITPISVLCFSYFI